MLEYFRRLVMIDINILTLFGIDVQNLEKYEQIDCDTNSVTFLIRTVKLKKCCPNCGSINFGIKDYKLKKYVFKSQTGINININFEHRRFRCKDCNKTFFDFNPFIGNKNYKISKNKIIEVVNFLKDGLPVTLISKYSFLSVSSINRILDKYIKVKRKPLPKIISIDEFCSFNSNTESKYACMMVNYEDGSIIDVLPSRRTPWLHQYFSLIPYDEIHNVRYVVMDMYKPYKEAFHSFNKDIIFIIDPFHYIRYVTDAIEKVRIKTMKRFLHEDIEYKLLKKYRKVLLTKHDPDECFRRKRIKKLSSSILYEDDILNALLNIDESLKEAYYLGHSFLKELDKMDYDEFKKFLNITIIKFQTSSLSEFKSVGETFQNWQREIENSYLKIFNGKRVSNALIEGKNNKVKTLKKACYGLTNFEHLRKRIFLIFEKTPRNK